MTRLIAVGVTVLAAAALTGSASASQLIDRNAKNVSLQVNAKKEALVRYTVGGVQKHVLAWGAVNAVPPTRGRTQVAFKLDYTGGYGKYHNANYWQTSFQGACIHYDGPAIPYVVAACKAQDGTYWALQEWQRNLPDYGVAPTAKQSAPELRLSHWNGPVPILSISVDWSYHKYDQIFGTYSYGGLGVFGFKSTSSGNRSTASAATSTSTRSAPRTARAGAATTAS
jgi:hypothetical protein